MHLDAVSVSGHHVVRAGGVRGPSGVRGHPGAEAGQHKEAHNEEHPQLITSPILTCLESEDIVTEVCCGELVEVNVSQQAEGDGVSQSIPFSLLVKNVSELFSYWLLKSCTCQCDTNTFSQSLLTLFMSRISGI